MEQAAATGPSAAVGRSASSVGNVGWGQEVALGSAAALTGEVVHLDDDDGRHWHGFAVPDQGAMGMGTEGDVSARPGQSIQGDRRYWRGT